MGIVKFIELGVWPIKLCLYCFNTSGSLHSDLPRVTIEMNTPTSSKIPSTDPSTCMENTPKASLCCPQGCRGTGEHRAAGTCRDIPPPSPQLWFEPLVMYVQENKPCQTYMSRNVPCYNWLRWDPAVCWSNLGYRLLIWIFSKHLQVCSYQQ